MFALPVCRGNRSPARLAPRPGEQGHLMRSVDRSLLAIPRSPLTRDQYLMSFGQMVDVFTVNWRTRHRCLKLFFAFLLEE